MDSISRTPSSEGQQTAHAENYQPSFLSEVEDFGRGLVHGGLEDPINGITQFSNHLVGTSIPELHIVDAEKADRSIGGRIGEGIGKAADFVGLSMATGGIGSSFGLAGSVLRMGAVGAAYGGFMQPTDEKSGGNFFLDRAKNAGVDAATFMAMGGTAAALNASGMFAVPAARSLMGSLTYGGITGVSGGLAHAESSALSQGNLLPTGSQLASDVATYGAFGAAAGGLGYGYQRMTLPEATRIQSGNSSIMVQNDQSGAPVKVVQSMPGRGFDSSVRMTWTSTKLTTGDWSDSTVGRYPGSMLKLDNIGQPELKDVIRENNGAVTTVDSSGIHRTYTPGKPYASDYTRAVEAEKAGFPGAVKTDNGFEYRDSSGKLYQTIKVDDSTYRSYDEHGNLNYAAPKVTSRVGLQLNVDRTALGYNADNAINSVTIGPPSEGQIKLYDDGAGTWDARIDGQQYKWNGKVRVIPGQTPGAADQIEFAPQNGEATRLPLVGSKDAVTELMKTNGQFVPGGTGFSFVQIDSDGNATLTGGSNTYAATSVNGQSVRPGAQIRINPGDHISVRADIGDRFAQYKTSTFDWMKDLSGREQIGQHPVAPNTQFDLSYDYKIPESVARVEPAASAEATQPTLQATSDGHLIANGGAKDIDTRIGINGKWLSPGEQAQVNAGDKVTVAKVMSDDPPIWNHIDLPWARTVDGNLALNGTALTPGEPFFVDIQKYDPFKR